MASLNQRLTLSLMASLALFFIAQTWIIGNEVEVLSEQNLISRMEHDQEELLAALQWSPPSLPVLDADRIPSIYQRPFSGHYFQIEVADIKLHSRSLWDETLPELAGVLERNVMGPKQVHLLMLSREFTMLGQQVKIRIAEDISHIESTTASFQQHLLLFATAAMLLLLLLQAWVVLHSLKPLGCIRDQLGQLEKGEVEKITTPAPSEIMPLVEEVNQLLQLMQQRLKRSRHALGDLAHALKTPLAVMGQVVQRQTGDEDQVLLLQQLQHIERRIELELVRARTAGRMPGGLWAEPFRDLNDMVYMLNQVFPSIRITLFMDETMSIAADREDMLELFGNLIENACKWASSEVYCHISCQEQGFSIQVEDDGPGIVRDEYQSLLVRGARADESKSGHGLGFSIVHEIISVYDGKMTLSRSDTLHGLQVNISLFQA